MSDAQPAGPVSRARYDREKRARATAEALLEAKSRELYFANQRLLAEAEAVRTALVETETLRSREAAALRDRSILSDALAALSGKSNADEAMQALLAALQTGFDIFDAGFVRAEGAGVILAAAARPDHAGLALALPADILARPRRLGPLAAVAAGASLPGGTGRYASVLIAPLAIQGGSPCALLLGGQTADRFTPADLRLLERVAAFASPALNALREARRNELLVSLLEGRPVSAAGGVLDAPLEAVHRAFTRLTDMQGQVVGILDDLLGAPLNEADTAIEMALARMGPLTGTDRVYVFRLRPGGGFIDNTHEWCAPGIAPARPMQQDLPAAMIDHWRGDFDAGRDIHIADVAALPDTAPERAFLQQKGIKSLLMVPLLQDGAFRGFVGYVAIRDQRSFLQGEIHLIRSVAKVIASVLARRDTKARLVDAYAEAAAQQTRLLSVLSAMPDLVVELDREGRFVTWHSGDVIVPDAIGAAFAGRLVEDVLPAELAAEARRVLAEIDAGQRPAPRSFPLSLTATAEQWWQLSAAAMGDIGYLFVLRDITLARAQTAEIERLSEIARRTTNLVVITGPDGRIEWVNAAFEQSTGWTLAEVHGQNPGRLLQSPGTDPATVRRIRAALDRGEAVQEEILNRARDGREYWLALDIQPLHDIAGTLRGFMAVETDITERRAQADALRQSAEDAARAHRSLEAAVGALRDGFVLYDAEDRLVICNEPYRQIYARSAPAIVPGATFESILRYGLARGEYADAVGREEAWLAERLARHRQPDSEIEQKLADGRWLRIFEKAMPDGGRVGLRVDITALKHAELRALADRAAAMEASQDGIAITDPRGRFLYMNQAHLEMFGLSDEAEVIGRPWSILYGEAEAEWMQANAMPELFARGRWSGEVIGQDRNGAPVDQDVSLTLKDDGGILCITRDISARRRDAVERERLNEELHLAQRREVVGQLAAGLAHDFNNLLATISGSASLIVTAADPGGSVATGARRIEVAADQAAGLVRRLLMLGARPADRRLLDLRQSLREAADLARASLKVPQRVILSLPDTPVEAMVDPTDILQVVLNLAINARDALDGHPGEIALSLAEAEPAATSGSFAVGQLDPSRRYARLTVADTGPGMDEALAARAFQPYVTTKGDKGTGLGLAIVASVVKANDGAIRLTTAPGRGTRFDVLWPLGPASEPPAEAAVGELTGRLDGHAILVVDDQEDVLAVLTAMLESAGAEVAPTTEPADVLAAVRADPGAWRLVVTDFDMPGQNGAELAGRLAEIAPRLPVILVTALAGVAGRSGARFDAVLAKPVDRAALVRAAESAIIRAKPEG